MKDWKDLGGGQWKLTISVDGDPMTPPSVFRGTREEIADKLADSQMSANRRIAELRRGGNGSGAAPPPPSGPRPLSPSERLQAVADLQNPATVDSAVTRVMESVIGPVSEVRDNNAAGRVERDTKTAMKAAEMFVERTPEWYNSAHNKETLVQYVKAQGLNPLDTNTYTTAFEALSAAQLLQSKPAESDDDNHESEASEGRNAPDANARPKTPTRYSTSIRSSDISGRAPVPSGKPHLKYTREQLQTLSAADYKRLMQTDRAELERCEAYYAKTRRTG
jgi:hypothetical protein